MSTRTKESDLTEWWSLAAIGSPTTLFWCTRCYTSYSKQLQCSFFVTQHRAPNERGRSVSIRMLVNCVLQSVQITQLVFPSSAASTRGRIVNQLRRESRQRIVICYTISRPLLLNLGSWIMTLLIYSILMSVFVKPLCQETEGKIIIWSYWVF